MIFIAAGSIDRSQPLFSAPISDEILIVPGQSVILIIWLVINV